MQLATVSVLQFPLDLFGSDAAEVVRCRDRFKYALDLDLDDQDFHFRVLGGFRDRLLEEGRADQLFDVAGPAERGRVGSRADHPAHRFHHVLAAARDLTRLELVVEAVRAALEELARTADHALACLVDDD